MTNWNEYKLSDLMDVIGGGTPKTSVSEYWGGDIPWLSVVDFGNDYKKVFDSEKKITEKGLENSSTKLLKEGQLIISARGTVGELAVLGRDMAFNQSCYGLNAKLEICTNDFLYYLMKCKISELKRNAHGAVFDTITRNTFETVSVSIPDLPTQTAIAEILSSLDDKIELNKKINQELENLAQTLFESWFIDFEFPNENGEPYKSSGGEMVDSELGEIPKGWDIIKVQDLEHKLQTGTRPKGGVGGITKGVPSIGAESIKKLGYYDFSKVKFVTEEFAAKMRRGKVEGYELLIYKDGGKPGTFIPHFSMFGEGFPFDSFFINEHVFLLDFFNKQFNCFCYFYFDSEYVRPVFENNGGKAAIPGINQEDVKHLWVFNPDLELVKLFGQFAHSSVSTILKNCKENIQLTNLRDTLLPKLISGELEVSQTQSIS